MKRTDKAVRAASYVAGITAIAGAMLLAVLLVLSIIGLIHPRKTIIALYTDSVSKMYDGTAAQVSTPEIGYGSLHAGHTLKVTNRPKYSTVGQYVNVPEFVIVDETGADVTGLYDIRMNYGDLTILPRQIMLTSYSSSKVYDGEALTAGKVLLTAGTLAPGHELVTEEGNSLILPGTEQARPVYRIVESNGGDVTDQYDVWEDFGTLEVLPITLTITTASAQKGYDGKSLSADGWAHVGGALLEGHSLDMTVTASIRDAGIVPNEGKAVVLDKDGKDVTALYRMDYQFGTLEVTGIPLYISTASARKVYDGQPLSVPQWELTRGQLEPGAVVQVQSGTVSDEIGTVDNILRFSVVDANGTDVTRRYSIVCDYGTLTIQPRAVSIRTGSAEKVYDGQPLSCDSFEIISGSLCQDEQIVLSCIAITEVGYADNYALDCTIYRVEEDGSRTDVTACYRITFDYGMLKITAP